MFNSINAEWMHSTDGFYCSLDNIHKAIYLSLLFVFTPDQVHWEQIVETDHYVGVDFKEKIFSVKWTLLEFIEWERMLKTWLN